MSVLVVRVHYNAFGRFNPDSVNEGRLFGKARINPDQDKLQGELKLVYLARFWGCEASLPGEAEGKAWGLEAKVLLEKTSANAWRERRASLGFEAKVCGVRTKTHSNLRLTMTINSKR